MPSARWIRRARTLLQSVAAVALIAIVTSLCYHLPGLNPTTVALTYLVTTLVIAMRLGLIEAIVASIVSTVCYNFFFLPPLHTFRIAEPQNWVSLLAFLAASLVASRLSQQAKQRAAEATRRQRELEQLHAVSRAVLLCEESESLAGKLAGEIREAYGAAVVAIYDRGNGQTVWAGAEERFDGIEQQLRNAASAGGLFRDREHDSVVSAFGLAPRPAGGFALIGTPVSDDALESLSNLIAIGLEKARHQEVTTRAEAARQTQELKSTLLDAIAHEFKTPLTTVKAAASALRSPCASDPEQQREFAMVIEQEADRLTRLVTEAIHLARIDAGKTRLDKKLWEPRMLIEAGVAAIEPMLEGRLVQLRVAEGLPAVEVDRDLIQMVVRELIDNAVKYSEPQSPIRVSALQAGAFVKIGIWNDGTPIPEWERSRVFERFYRGSTAGRQSPGTGMGLAIAREIMAAHGGDLRVESSAERGTEFAMLVPLPAEGAGA